MNSVKKNQFIQTLAERFNVPKKQAARAAREGRNPRTGEKIQIKASKKAKFVPAKALKEAVL